LQFAFCNSLTGRYRDYRLPGNNSSGADHLF